MAANESGRGTTGGSSLAAQGARFVGAGTVNTILTFLLYEGLILVVSYPVAYTLSYLVGLALTATIGAKVVFQVPLTLKAASSFAAVYGASYLVGLGLLHLLVSCASIAAWLAPVFVLIVTVPLAFCGSRFAASWSAARSV